jgi:ABC-type molybdate transport system ATPase subunit
MSQNSLPDKLPSIEKILQRISSAERSQQKEIRITIQEARELCLELSLITAKLGSTLNEIHRSLLEIKESTSNINVKVDGGNF